MSSSRRNGVRTKTKPPCEASVILPEGFREERDTDTTQAAELRSEIHDIY